HTMSDGSSGNLEGPLRSILKKPTRSPVRVPEMQLEDPQAVPQPPHQQILRSPEPTRSKRKARMPTQGAKPSARHIEEAAGDVSDLSASLLLACLFCHFSDCLTLVPSTCGFGVRSLCFPELCCSPSCCSNVDCGFLEVCQHTTECLELAMEVSELCYH
ncbi:uncharacterized protein O3C94_022649, partial [Discoglossus pictus]